MNDKYEVPESRIEELEAKIAKLNRKAAKLGCDPITITISEETKQVERTRAIIDCDDTAFRTEIVTAREVTVEGEAPKLNGWNVIASIDYVGGEPIFHKLSDEELPLRFRTQGAICEHCASNRFRKYVYALKSGADEWKQVGSTCLKDFTGHSNPHGIASYLQWLRDIIVFMEDTESYGQGDVRELLTRFLTAACAVVRIDGGYVSRRKAEEARDRNLNLPATVDSTWARLNGSKIRYAGSEAAASEEDKAKAKAIIEWITTELAAKEDLNDYEYNLVTVAKLGSVGHRDGGIASSAVSAYNRAQGFYYERTPEGTPILKQEERQEPAAGHIGTEGERGEFELIVERVIPDVGYYCSTLVKFMDAEGHEAVWFASSQPELEPGQAYRVKATVKRHGYYDGHDQTTLSRCQVTQREGVGAA